MNDTQGPTRAELDSAEADSLTAHPARLRPKDAATLILLRRCDDGPKLLMGRRHRRHTFMPGKFVFPGGRRDPADSRIAVSSPLPESDMERLLAGMGARATRSRANGLALAAVRETYEEAGILVGNTGPFSCKQADWQAFGQLGVQPALGGLRFLARAVTPPGRVRRYDTRFFAGFEDCVARVLPDGGPTEELEELAWLTIPEALATDVPLITATVLRELATRLIDDPELVRNDVGVPYFYLKGDRLVRETT
jgi:8-oxo-dGTP pyrophosphatase MutT (NUDIX family)